MAKFFMALALSTPMTVLAEVDKTSSAYQGGKVAGYVFLGILVYLIIKKFLSK